MPRQPLQVAAVKAKEIEGVESHVRGAVPIRSLTVDTSSSNVISAPANLLVGALVQMSGALERRCCWSSSRDGIILGSHG